MKVEKSAETLSVSKDGMEFIMRRDKVFFKEPMSKDTNNSWRMIVSCRAMNNRIYKKHYGYGDFLVTYLQGGLVFAQYEEEI